MTGRQEYLEQNFIQQAFALVAIITDVDKHEALKYHSLNKRIDSSSIFLSIAIQFSMNNQ